MKANNQRLSAAPQSQHRAKTSIAADKPCWTESPVGRSCCGSCTIRGFDSIALALRRIMTPRSAIAPGVNHSPRGIGPGYCAKPDRHQTNTRQPQHSRRDFVPIIAPRGLICFAILSLQNYFLGRFSGYFCAVAQ